MTAALLFAATFAVVFTLGLQQINLERRDMLAAFATSPLIGISNLVLFKVLPGPTDWLDHAGYLAGGAIGIVASMWMHPVLVRMFERLPAPVTLLDNHARRMGERLRLGTELADEVARSDIESYCSFEKMGRFTWYDTSTCHPEGAEVEAGVDKAVRYLDLRGTLVRHPVQRHLVRFEA